MLMTPETRSEDQAQRLELKAQDQRLNVLGVQGAGISHWGPEILVGATREVHFTQQGGALRTG
jgi:hypothetical protein